MLDTRYHKGNLTPSWWKTETRLWCTANNMAFDDLATQGARSSAVMALASQSRYDPVSAPEDLIWSTFVLTALGPGCPDIELAGNGTVTYNLADDVLSSEVTCAEGFTFPGTDVFKQHLLCQGSLWNDTVEPCVGESSHSLLNYISIWRHCLSHLVSVLPFLSYSFPLSPLSVSLFMPLSISLYLDRPRESGGGGGVGV